MAILYLTVIGNSPRTRTVRLEYERVVVYPDWVCCHPPVEQWGNGSAARHVPGESPEAYDGEACDLYPTHRVNRVLGESVPLSQEERTNNPDVLYTVI